MTDSEKENLIRIASFLKRLPSCHACVVEFQEHNCQCISARWAGREIIKTIERYEWVTMALVKT